MGASMANLFQEMYEGATKGLLGVEPGHRVEKGLDAGTGAGPLL
jgi:hypothetical protein